MKYILSEGGFKINKKAPVIIDVFESENIIEAKKIAKQKGPTFWVEAYVKRIVEFDIRMGGKPKDFFTKFADKL